MMQKQLVWLGALVGGTIGAYIPALWGDNSLFSFSALILSTIGGIAGIYICFKLSQ